MQSHVLYHYETLFHQVSGVRLGTRPRFTRLPKWQGRDLNLARI